MRRLFLASAAMAMAVVVALTAGSDLRVAHADGFTYHFDAAMTPAGPSGSMNLGEVVAVDTYVQLNPGGAASDQPFFDVASTQWDALHIPISADHACAAGGFPAPCPPAAAFNGVMPIGDEQGTNSFTIRTNLISGSPFGAADPNGVPSINQCGAAGTTTVSPSFTIYSSKVSGAALGGPPYADFTGHATYVNTNDRDSDGVAEDQEDNTLDGLPDGVSRMPDWIPDFNASLGLTAGFFSRGYGIAPIAGVTATSVNFNTYMLGDLTGNGATDFLSFTVLAVPFSLSVPTPGTTSQFVDTCTPFDTLVALDAVSTPSGVPVRQIRSLATDNTHQYRLLLSSADDWDGDGVANAFDNCLTVPNGPQTDTNGNGIGDACGGGSLATSTASDVPVPFYDDDGDGWGNVRSDNCPTVSNPLQTSVGDGVGVDCNAAPTIRGNGAGWSLISGVGGSNSLEDANAIYHDHDDILIDVWATAAAGDPGGFLGAGNETPGLGLFSVVAATGQPLLDSNDNLTPDCLNLSGSQILDWGSDSDGDGWSDAMEVRGKPYGGCGSLAAFAGPGADSDPLRPCTGADAGNLAKIRSDANGDGAINIFDLQFVAGFFGQSPSASSDPRHAADANKDGAINIFDLQQVAGFFGQSPVCK